jgi:phosphatidylglycerophosphate synthase
MMKIPVLSKPGDGPISLLINRRISCIISTRLVKKVTPNQATGLALVIGTASMFLYIQGSWILGGLSLQLSSVFSGVDGEIARLRNQCTDWGDFFDTFIDRFVEYLAIAGMTIGLFRVLGTYCVWCGILLLGSIFMLTTASEKFRSATGKNYPKQKFDKYFAWISAGRDARLFVLALGSFFATISPWFLFGVMIGLAGLGHVNLFIRMVMIKGRFQNL